MLIKKNYAEAVNLFLQILDSMASHYVVDEHYTYFDDMYSPEYAANDC